MSSPTHELEAAGERVKVGVCTMVAVFADGWQYRCRRPHDAGTLHSWQCGWTTDDALANPLGFPCFLPRGHTEDHASQVPVTVRWYNSIGDQVYSLARRATPTVEYDTEEAKRAAVHVAEVLAAYRDALSPIFKEEQRDLLVRDYAHQMVQALSHPLMVLKPSVPHEPIRKGDWQQ